VVVFCRSVKRCEELVGLLECEMYHSRYGGKSQGLASWTGGDNKVIVATSALGTGIDQKGITHVVHVQRPWILIEYGQDSGRVGREGGKVKTMILMSTEEYTELEEMEDESMREDEHWLRKFITAEHCRGLVLWEYFDGVEMTMGCNGLGGEKCDNCMGREGLRARFKNR